MMELNLRMFFLNSRKSVLMAAVIGGVMFSSPALAVISNTVTVTGKDPNTQSVQATATETVDVADAVYQLTQSSFAHSPVGPVGANTVVTWTVTYKNTGNVTLYDIDPQLSVGGVDNANAIEELLNLNDSLNGTTGDSVDSVTTDTIINKLAPGDEVTYTIKTTVVQDDIDNDLDRVIQGQDSVVYYHTSGGTQYTLATTSESVGLVAQLPKLVVSKIGYRDYTGTKTAVDGSTDNVPAGETITYEYIIENTGNVTITDLSLTDAHTADGTAPVPNIESATLTNGNGNSTDSADTVTGNTTWSSLAPGDKLTVTATYTVVTSDIAKYQ